MLRQRDGAKYPSADTLIIHGGTGDTEYVIKAAIKNYDEYRPLRPDGLGYFTVSVFAAMGGLTEAQVASGLRHGTYGVASAGEIGFKFLPTTDEGFSPEWLRDVHFDICLPDLEDDRLVTTDPVDDRELTQACWEHLQSPVDALLDVFDRRRKT